MTASPTLELSVQVNSVTGPIELEDPANGYSLHADSFAQRAYTHRNVEVSSPWIKGTYATDSVLDNANEALVIWVSGWDPVAGVESQYLYQQRMDTLMACFDQLSYQLTRQIGDAVEVWDCEVSDYTVETQQEFIFATIGVLRVSLNRRPDAPLTKFAPPMPPPPEGDWEKIFLSRALGAPFPSGADAFVAGSVLSEGRL